MMFNTWAEIASVSGSVAGLLTIVFVPLFKRWMKQWHFSLNETIDNRVTPHFAEMMTEIMNTQNEVKTIKEKIVNHESRISFLEGMNKGKEVT